MSYSTKSTYDDAHLPNYSNKRGKSVVDIQKVIDLINMFTWKDESMKKRFIRENVKSILRNFTPESPVGSLRNHCVHKILALLDGIVQADGTLVTYENNLSIVNQIFDTLEECHHMWSNNVYDVFKQGDPQYNWASNFKPYDYYFECDKKKFNREEFSKNVRLSTFLRDAYFWAVSNEHYHKDSMEYLSKWEKWMEANE